MLINATGAGKKVTIQSNANIILSPVAGSEATRIVGGGVEANLAWDYPIQARTIVANPGTALQQFAGADLSLADLDYFFGAGNTKAYYRFGAGAALVTDEVGTYKLTLPGGVG